MQVAASTMCSPGRFTHFLSLKYIRSCVKRSLNVMLPGKRTWKSGFLSRTVIKIWRPSKILAPFGEYMRVTSLSLISVTTRGNFWMKTESGVGAIFFAVRRYTKMKRCEGTGTSTSDQTSSWERSFGFPTHSSGHVVLLTVVRCWSPLRPSQLR